MCVFHGWGIRSMCRTHFEIRKMIIVINVTIRTNVHTRANEPVRVSLKVMEGKGKKKFRMGWVVDAPSQIYIEKDE